MRMSHRQKVKLAKKLRTPNELIMRVSLWSTRAWEIRKKGIKERVEKRITDIKKRKELRKAKKEKNEEIIIRN